MKFLQTYLKSLSVFLLAWFSVLWVYAALSTVNSGDPLTATSWNEMVSKLTSLNTNNDDLVTKSYVDSQVSANSSWVEFVGYTTATYNGNMWGITGPTQKCQQEFPWSYICSYKDLITSNASYPSSGNAWFIDYDRYPDSTCVNFSSTVNTNSSQYRIPYINSSGTTATETCDKSYPIACCRG